MTRYLRPGLSSPPQPSSHFICSLRRHPLKSRGQRWSFVEARSSSTYRPTCASTRPSATSAPRSIWRNALGFNTGSKTFFVDGTWRISRRNQLQVDYEQIDRDVSHSILSNPIIFHNTIFDRSATVDAFFDSRYLSAYYGFAFVATPSVELGVSIGVTLVRLHAGVGLSGGTSDTTVSRDLTEETKFDVPVPLPGFFVNVRPHPRVTLIGSTRLLKITINKISASMVEAKAGAEVKLVGPLGVGGTYYYNRISAERDESDPNGKIVYSFNGPQVYGILAF